MARSKRDGVEVQGGCVGLEMSELMRHKRKRVASWIQRVSTLVLQNIGQQSG